MFTRLGKIFRFKFAFDNFCEPFPATFTQNVARLLADFQDECVQLRIGYFSGFVVFAV
jgi:hypothetical protein